MARARVLTWRRMTTQTKRTFSETADPREVPTYNLSEAAVYLGIPATTLRSWTKGRTYPTTQGEKFFAPLIEPADPARTFLSFANLAEAHILQATRDREIPIPNVRVVMDYVQKQWPSSHPLLSKEFYRFGKQLFVKMLEEDDESLPVNASKAGQIGLKAILDECLERLERDNTGYPIRIFPLRTNSLVLDVNVASGQPVIKETRLLASMLSSRNKAGDSVHDLALTYGLKEDDVEEAIKHFRAA